jgi:hypothetical protein
LKLNAGITEIDIYWESVLNQLGIPAEKLKPGQAADPGEIPVIIASKKNYLFKETLNRFLNNGGAVLTEADTASSMFGIKVKRKSIKYIFSKGDDVFKPEGICDISRNCLIAADANHLPDQDGNNTILTARINNGVLIVLPSGFISLIGDRRIRRKNFYSLYGNKETNERVSAVSKGMVLHIIRNALEFLYHSRELPYVSLWHFPDGKENIFAFRIDTDFVSREKLHEFYKIINKTGLKATWFVETKSSENILSDFNNFTNQEIALHCYRHRVFTSYTTNLIEIKKGISLLKNNNINKCGYAAPYGQWNKSLGKAITELGFCYTSEFGYAYDALPMFPVSNSGTYTALQIPIHPISQGRLHWGGHNSEQMLQYFQSIYAQKASLYEPMIIYAHPSELKFGVMEKIIENGLSYNFTNLTFKEYAGWWKKRGSLNWEASFDGNEVKIITSNKDESFWAGILKPGNDLILKPLINNAAEEKKLREPVYKLNSFFNAEELRKTTKRMIYHDILSFYRKLKQ